jgi:hypothetical protein
VLHGPSIEHRQHRADAQQDMHEQIRFVVAALTEPGAPFVDWLLQPHAQAMLHAAGFSQ